MSILSVDNISPIGSGTSVTVNSAATLVLNNANSTGVITATSFVGSGANLTGLAGGGTGLDLNDNTKIRLGAGDDLSLFHDGNRSVINNSTGELRIVSGSDIIIGKRSADDTSYSELIAAFKVDGAVELYHDNSKKLETNSTGAKVYGSLLVDSFLDISPPGNNAVLIKNPANGIIGFGANNQTNQVIITTDGHLGITGDSKELRLGASEDLKLYHDGNDSYIDDAGVGSLILRTTTNSNVTIKSTNDVMAKFMTADRVELYHNNSKKFETMSSGARIQGGLLFNSDTAAANTLDDYEEGTWTPDWRGASALGTTTYGTYNVASYVKIGNQVTIRGFSQIRGSSGGSGFWFINNLPFFVGGGDDRRYRSVGNVLLSNFNFQDSERDIMCFIERNNNDMQIRGTRDNLSDSPNISVNMDTNFDITWTITYPTV